MRMTLNRQNMTIQEGRPCTQTIPLGTAYPVWTGIGAVGAVLVGILIFREPATFWRLFFLTTLIGSIIGLKALS
jgi:quaternary ammonium compound-resistance protein SugE